MELRPEKREGLARVFFALLGLAQCLAHLTLAAKAYQ